MIFAVLVFAACAGGDRTTDVCPNEEWHWVVQPIGEDLVTSRRGLEKSLDTLPLSPILRPRPIVSKPAGKGTLSIGNATTGYLVAGRQLPLVGEHHRVLDVQSSRGTNCGTDELVDGVLSAAEAVARKHPGAVLAVGNMSRGGGGDFVWSVSHNAGRDVDLGFYLVSDDGRDVLPPDLIKVSRDLTARWPGGSGRFDLDRNWRLFKSLATNQKFSLQWLFLASFLREKLLEHARRIGEPEALVKKVGEVMAQPSRSFPHDDHVHVRLYCSKDDLLEGCRDMGSNRSWYEDSSAMVKTRIAKLKKLTRSTKPDTRVSALIVLGRMGDRQVMPVVLGRLNDPNVDVARSAAGAVFELGVRGYETRVASAIAQTRDGEVARLLLTALYRHMSPSRAGAVYSRLLGVKGVVGMDAGALKMEATEADWALAGLLGVGAEYSVPALVAALDRSDVDHGAIRDALKGLTGAQVDDNVDNSGAWRKWLEARADWKPEHWWAEALGDPDPQSADLSRVLMLARRQVGHAVTPEVLAKAVKTGRLRIPYLAIEPLDDLAIAAGW